MSEVGDLLVGTVFLRPYVFVFLAVYLVAAVRDLGGRRTLAFTGWAWAVAFLAEFSSTRSGIPFGLYHYTETTRGQELFVANVPFMDSLSFTFLAYAAFSLARLGLRRSRGLGVIVLSGVLMMLLDVVIDPLAVRGDQWFLGRLFFYSDGGAYFGVPLSNFLGWALVGWAIVAGFLACVSRIEGLGRPGIGAGLYYGVLAFNLAVTGWIGELLLLTLGVMIHLAVFAVLWWLPRAGILGSGSTIANRLLAASSAGFARAIEGGGLGRGAEPPSEV